MTGTVRFMVRLIRAGVRAYERKWSFLGIFAVAFFGIVFVLARFDLLPETASASATPAVVLAASPHNATRVNSGTTVGELPMSIEIPRIGLSATITNPTTTDIKALDAALLSGAVRYPTSARLGETGNVVLFGHSSYLPIVHNQSYKTFNNIQKLSVGDVVTMSSLGTAYTYRVTSVAKENAKDNSAISLATVGKTLTLVTCNSFATKEDRFVVTADFVESHAISG